MRLSRTSTFDRNTILHFISSQRVALPKTLEVFSTKHEVCWIENVEPIQPRISYDIARCLEVKSPLRRLVDDLSCYSKEQMLLVDSEVDVQQMLLNGKISVLKSPDSIIIDPVAFKLRFCISQLNNKLRLNAILHNDGLKCKDLSYLLGIQRYTESSLSAEFHGITGMGWSLDTDRKPSEAFSAPVINIGNTNKDKSVNTEVSEIADINTKLLTIPDDKIKSIADLTQEQSLNNVWRELRTKRLTASMFGLILNAVKSNKYPSSLFKTLLNQYDLSFVKSIQWGIAHEEDARNAYEMETGSKVQATGLWLHTSGILGASPDGLLADGIGIVEFKCPYSVREMKVDDAIDSNPKFYLKRRDDGTVYLNPDHTYYHQIQGMLYIIGREYCDFCVWTPVCKPYILRIEKDPSWEKCLIQLINFYFKQFLPHVVGNDDEACLYEGYLELVVKVDDVLDDNKLKRSERKQRKSDEAKEPDTTAPTTLDSSSLTTITFDDILKLSVLTSYPLDKWPPKLWFAMREHRLTSSSFHAVLSAVSRNSYTPSLYKSIMDEYFMSNTPAAKFAQLNKIKAVNLYEQERNLTVLPSGIWLDVSGILGASITGLLGDGKGIIDIRCLYKYRNMSDITEIIKLNDPNFHLEEVEGEIKLKTSHRIYTQLQGGLYLSRRQYCDAITWTCNTIHVVRVQKDPEWFPNLEILRKFHLEMLFPKLCEKWGYTNVVKDLKRFGKD